MHMAGYSLGGAVLLGTLGAYVGSQVQAAPALPPGPSNGQPLPANVTNTTDNGAGSYWTTLTPLQANAYKAGLWAWIKGGSPPWPATTEDPTSAGITSLQSLDDLSNLGFATAAWATAQNIALGSIVYTNSTSGYVDPATFHAVSGT